MRRRILIQLQKLLYTLFSKYLAQEIIMILIYWSIWVIDSKPRFYSRNQNYLGSGSVTNDFHMQDLWREVYLYTKYLIYSALSVNWVLHCTLLATVDDWRSVAAHVHCETIVVAVSQIDTCPPASKSVSRLSCTERSQKKRRCHIVVKDKGKGNSRIRSTWRWLEDWSLPFLLDYPLWLE